MCIVSLFGCLLPFCWDNLLGPVLKEWLDKCAWKVHISRQLIFIFLKQLVLAIFIFRSKHVRCRSTDERSLNVACGVVHQPVYSIFNVLYRNPLFFWFKLSGLLSISRKAGICLDFERNVNKKAGGTIVASSVSAAHWDKKCSFLLLIFSRSVWKETRSRGAELSYSVLPFH